MHDTKSAYDATASAATRRRAAARAKKERQNIAHLSAQEAERRCFGDTVATTLGFSGHGDRSGEDNADADEVGALIPDPEVFRDLSITPMTGWRWDRDQRMAELGWPPPIYRGRYKFRDLNRYQKFKTNLLRRAIAKRDALLEARHQAITPAGNHVEVT